jgi:hypothetical protein
MRSPGAVRTDIDAHGKTGSIPTDAVENPSNGTAFGASTEILNDGRKACSDAPAPLNAIAA